MLTYDEIEIGMLLELEKTHKYEPSYIVKVIDKSEKIINGVTVHLIVIEDPEHPHQLISKPPCLFKPHFEENENRLNENQKDISLE